MYCIISMTSKNNGLPPTNAGQKAKLLLYYNTIIHPKASNSYIMIVLFNYINARLKIIVVVHKIRSCCL